MTNLSPDVSPVDRNHLPAISGQPFTAYRMTSSQTLWVASCYRDPAAPAEDRRQLYANFRDRFAYAMPDSPSLGELEFDLSRRKILWAERYGGSGIGFNGGGARVGNVEGFQLKGIGRNPLAGATTEFMHSYGAMTAAEAMYETIYAHLVNLVMPLGAAKVYGVILTDANAAYQFFTEGDAVETAGEGRCWGALLVREICRRPSHFLSAPAFSPAAELELAPDLSRVRAVNKALFKELRSAQQVVAYLGEFLGNCANQFAYARVMRLAHGALTASNLCMDGRWLDLARTTFIPADEDNGALMPSEIESSYVIPIVKEVLHTFAKFNLLQFNVGTLVEYYKEQFEAYLDYHVAALLGIDIDDVGEASAEAYQTLCAQILKLVCARKLRTLRPATAGAGEDRVQGLLVWLFASLNARRAAPATAPDLVAPAGFDWRATVDAFRTVMDDAARHQAPPLNRRGLFIRAAVISLKTALLQPLFYKKRVDDELRLLLRSGQPADFHALMASYHAMIDWIFAHPRGETVWLFRGNGIEIALRPDNSSLSLARDGVERQFGAAALIAQIAACEQAAFTLGHYCFRPYLARLLGVCATLELEHD